MNQEERLEYCKICKNRKLDMRSGLICGLTMKPADFEDSCPTFELDVYEKARLEERKKESSKRSRTGCLLFFLITLTVLDAIYVFFGAIDLIGLVFYPDEETKKVPLFLVSMYILVILTQFIFLIFIWFWKKLGVYGFVASSVTLLLIQVSLGDQMFQIIFNVVLTSILIIAAIVLQ